MKKDYTNLKMEDLLHDAFFTETIQHPTEETDLFWKMQVEDGVIDKREYHLAVLYLKSIQVEHARISKKDLNSSKEELFTSILFLPKISKKYLLNFILFIHKSLSSFLLHIF